MMRLIWAAGLLAVVGSATVPPAAAADLDGQQPRHSEPYDDPRYGDVYRHPDRRYAEPRYREPAEEEPRYDERRAPSPPPYRYERDDCRDCAPPPPPRYSQVEPRYGEPRYGGPAYGGGCLPKPEIKESLLRKGWRDFQDPELRQHVAWLTARGPSGHLYRIKIDRCSGAVLRAMALNAPGPAPYPYPGRRFERQYWN